MTQRAHTRQASINDAERISLKDRRNAEKNGKGKAWRHRMERMNGEGVEGWAEWWWFRRRRRRRKEIILDGWRNDGLQALHLSL